MGNTCPTSLPRLLTANSVVAPDGTTTGDTARIVFPAIPTGGQYCMLNQSFTGTVAAYVGSVWLRGNVGGEQTYLNINLAGATFYTTAITLTTTWQRFTVVTPALTAALYYLSIGTDRRDAAEGATLAQTIYAWGAQVELGAFPTSLIPTTAAAVTRAVDTCSMPVSAIPGFSTTAGSMSHEYAIAGGANPFGAVVSFAGSSATNDYINCDQLTSAGGATPTSPAIGTAASKIAGVGGAFCSFAIPTLIPAGTVHRGASSWAVGAQMHGAHDGAGEISNSGTNASLPVLVNLLIGGVINNQAMISQWARRTQYWPRALSTAELQAVTR